jgi:hypothetical protein
MHVLSRPLIIENKAHTVAIFAGVVEDVMQGGKTYGRVRDLL